MGQVPSKYFLPSAPYGASEAANALQPTQPAGQNPQTPLLPPNFQDPGTAVQGATQQIAGQVNPFSGGGGMMGGGGSSAVINQQQRNQWLRGLLGLLLLLFSSSSLLATTTVTGNLQDLSTTPVTSGVFVRFWLRGCGGAQPRVNGVTLIAPTSGAVYYKDFVADGNGNISGSIYSTRDATGNGNGQIECPTNIFTATWYGVQLFYNGRSGPEVPVAAKNGATLNVTNVTPLTANPVVNPPTGDNVYLRLDGGNSPVTGNVQFAGSLTASGAATLANINNCVQVEGVVYAFTDVGVNAAIAAAKANGTNCVKLGLGAATQYYTFSNTVTVAAGIQNTAEFTLDMTNAWIHCEFTGTCIRAGETGVEHSHIHFIGGTIQRTSSGSYFHDFSPCATCPSNSTVSTGVEWLNVNGGDWSLGFNIIGFRNGLYVRSSNGHSSYYNMFRPEYLFDNLIDYLFQPNNDVNGGVNDNFVVGGEAQKATDSFDFSAATNGAPGGNCIVVNNDTNPLVTFMAQANVFDTSCESAVSTAGHKPEAGVYINGGGNDFRLYNEGFSKNAWTVDNSVQAAVSPGGADVLFNRFTSKSGGLPISGLSSFRDQSTNIYQTIIGQRSLYVTGGNGCNATPCPAATDAGMVFNEVNAQGNTAYSYRAFGSEQIKWDGFGHFTVNEAAAGTGVAGRDVWWADSTAHRLKANNNNGGAVTIPYLESSDAWTGTESFSGNTVALTADWTCGTGGTVSSCTSATIIGSGGGVPLTFTLPLATRSYTLECDGVVGQATAATANQWNLLTATNGATNVTANYSMNTAAAAMTGGAVTDQASTTTTFQIAPSWTLGGTATKMPFHIWAKIEGASASGTVLSLQLLAPTAADLVTIYRGSACRLF